MKYSLLPVYRCVHVSLGSCINTPSSNPVPTVRFTSPTYDVVENAGPAVVCVMKDLEVVGSFDVTITSRETIPQDAEGMHSAQVQVPIALLMCLLTKLSNSRAEKVIVVLLSTVNWSTVSCQPTVYAIIISAGINSMVDYGGVFTTSVKKV